MENSIVSFITSPTFNGPLLILKILILGFSSIVFISIVLLLLKTRWLRFRILEDIFEFFTYRPYGVKKLIKQWAKIKGRLETALESEYKLAIIEADSLIDEILGKLGYSGETLGERLKQISPAIIPNVQELLEAHKIRNNIVHDPDYRLDLDTTRKTMLIYEKVLTDLGAM